jgi:hypothetical protein
MDMPATRERTKAFDSRQDLIQLIVCPFQSPLRVRVLDESQSATSRTVRLKDRKRHSLEYREEMINIEFPSRS